MATFPTDVAAGTVRAILSCAVDHVKTDVVAAVNGAAVVGTAVVGTAVVGAAVVGAAAVVAAAAVVGQFKHEVD